jgi:F-type H+-transporting ATPase subunit epsilon
MAGFPFELVSPEKLVFSGEVEAVIVPGTEGEFTVLKDHAPVISSLKPGVIGVSETPNTVAQFYVSGGFAEAGPSGLTILADQAVPLAELDAGRLNAEMEALEDELAAAKSDEERRLAAERRDQLAELRAALKL